jgi:hypothetical protein
MAVFVSVLYDRQDRAKFRDSMHESKAPGQLLRYSRAAEGCDTLSDNT